MGGISKTNSGGGGADSPAGTAGSESSASAGSQADYGASGANSDSGPPGAAVGAGGVEHLGVAGSTAQLIAEAEAAGAAAPVDPATLAPGEAPNPNGEWKMLTPPAVEVICGVVLPAWEIRAEEQRPVSEALAECLEQVFPGGIEGKYACWVRLLVCCGAITVARVATNGGKLPPLFLPKGAKKPTPAPTPPAPAAPFARDPMGVTSLTE